MRTILYLLGLVVFYITHRNLECEGDKYLVRVIGVLYILICIMSYFIPPGG
jgi:hypothetical protein